MQNHFSTYFKYQAWANNAFCETLKTLDPSLHADQIYQTTQLMNHIHLVLRIFAAHLAGLPHDYKSDFPSQNPSLMQLHTDLAEIDRWYFDYVQEITSPQLDEMVSFAFTDGDKGYMSRAEILSHLVQHSVYHRGEVGRILKQISIRPPRDTFATFLHQANPARRLQGKPA